MKNLLLFFAFSLSVMYGYAGGCTGQNLSNPSNPAPACTGNQPAGNLCTDIVSICDLNGYCGSTSSSYTINTWSQLTTAFNSCGGLDNNSFLRFTASAATLSLNVWITYTECGEGIQIMVFRAAGANGCSGAVTSYGCWSPGTATAGPSVATFTGLTPGQEYIIMIDGFNGDDCNYVIGVNGSGGGVAIPPSVTPQTATICTGESVNLTATGGNGSYSWTASPHLNTTTGANVIATPPGPGTYTYTVNSSVGNPNCPTTGNSTATITVNSCGCNVTAGNSGAVCAGAAFGLTATTVTGATSYAWTGPNGFTSSQQNPTGISAPSTPGTYDYTVTVMYNGNPCTSTTTVTVTNCPSGCNINQIRQAFTDAGCIELSSCVGECSMYFLNPQSMTGSQAQAFAQTLGANLVSIQSMQENQCILNALNAIGQTGVIWIGFNDEAVEGTFVWYDQSPVGFTNWAPGEPNQSGNEDCVQIYPGGASPGTWNDLSCTSANARSIIEVNLCPVIDAGANHSVCIGQSTTLNASNTLFGSSPYTYAWDNGTLTQANTVTPTQTTTTYRVSTVDRYGCTASDSVVVNMNQLPVVNAGPDVAACPQDPVTLNGSGAVSYTWNNGVTNGVAFNPSATATYTVTGTDANGCQNTDNVVVTMNALPAVNAGNDFQVCEGASITLSGAGAVTYSWDNGVQNGVPFVINSTTTFNVTGTDGSGCENTDAITISVTPTPVVAFVPSVTSGCVPLTVTFTNSNISNNTSQWNFGDGTVINGPGPVTTTYSGIGCFDITMTSTTPDGCVGQTTYPSLVCVSPNPVAEFVPNPSELSLLNSVTTMINTSTGAASYIWNFGDGTDPSNLFSPTHAFPNVEPGSYNVELIAITDFGCRDTAYVTVVIEDELIYYVPNAFTPDDDQHNPVFKPIFTAGFDPYDYTLLIFNRWGEVIFESHDAQVGWDGTYGAGGNIVQDGSYTWRIDFKTTKTDERKMIIGNVNLIR